jgi:trimeric autotransporter adhesin
VSALASGSLSGTNNVAVGYQALFDNTTGTQNVAVGREALANNTTAVQNTAVGMYGLRNTTTGTNNIAMGYASLITNITGVANVALGHSALYSNTASANVAVGASALQNNTTASNNTAVGWKALLDNTTGANNVGLGYAALENNTTASSNVAVGWAALYYNTTASQNTAVGYQSLFTNETGQYNTALGYKALDVATNDNNTALGNEAGGGVTTGSSNTIIGAGAGNYITPLTTGSNNIIIGSLAEPSSATVSNEVTIGNDSVTVTRLKGNVGIGGTPSEPLSVFRTGGQEEGINIRNTSSGNGSRLTFETTRSDDSSVQDMAAIQVYAIAGYDSAANSDAIMTFQTQDSGTTAERMRIDNSGNVLVGCTAIPSSSVGGSAFQVAGDGRKQLIQSTTTTAQRALQEFYNPNGNVGSLGSNGSNAYYATTSDYRLKENIVPMIGALDKVALLKPCTYTWKNSQENSQGFIAHELAEICPEAVVGEKDAVNEDGSIKTQSIDTSFLVATLTAAIQEQQAIIETLTARIEALENK